MMMFHCLGARDATTQQRYCRSHYPKSALIVHATRPKSTVEDRTQAVTKISTEKTYAHPPLPQCQVYIVAAIPQQSMSGSCQYYTSGRL